METLPTIADEIERYLRTGDADPHFAAWPGGFMERARRAREELGDALVREVRRLAKGRSQRLLPQAESVALTRGKVEPMVCGLFPRAEREVVLATLERSVVFVTSANVESLLLDQDFDSSVWMLANLYLGSVGAPLLGEDAPRLVGLSEETTCYVSPEYFAEGDPFADFIVHEAAHVFHNCKRVTRRPARDADEGVAARHRVSEAGDLRVLVRGLLPRAGAREERDRETGAWGGVRSDRPDLRGTGGCRGGREHRGGGGERSQWLEGHPLAVCADESPPHGSPAAEGLLWGHRRSGSPALSPRSPRVSCDSVRDRWAGSDRE